MINMSLGLSKALSGTGVRHILKGCGQTVNRIGQVEDIAFAVTYLASPRAGFVNGVNMHLDGGGTGNIY